MRRLSLGITTLLAVHAALATELEVYKCTSPEGAVTYQQVPCATPGAVRLDVALAYPSAEAIARISRPQPVFAPPAGAAPLFITSPWVQRHARRSMDPRSPLYLPGMGR
jgi:hypothetical protein